MKLTHESIWAMPAGSAIDALVAERVMDYGRNEDGRWFDRKTGAAWGEFEPSRDIVAAWEVLVHLVERNDRVVVANSTTDRRCPFEIQAGNLGSVEPHTVFVHIGWPGGVERAGEHVGFANVHDIRGFPLAISRAALMTTLPPEVAP